MMSSEMSKKIFAAESTLSQVKELVYSLGAAFPFDDKLSDASFSTMNSDFSTGQN